MTYTYYDFFCGGGMAGVGLGADWRCSFANDFDAAKCKSYRANHDGAVLFEGDVRDVSPDALPGGADLAWASFPCQDLSLAGGRSGLTSKRSGAFWPFWKVMRALHDRGRAPKLIALENVVGALSSKRGLDFSEIGDAIAGLGYRFGCIVIDAIHFTPQSRPRAVWIAVREDVQIPDSSIALGPTADWHPKKLVAAYEGLSAPTKEAWIWWRLPAPPWRNAALRDILEVDPADAPWLAQNKVDRLLGLMAPLHRAKVEAAMSAEALRVGSVYRRTRVGENGAKQQRAEVRFDDVAGCLRTPRGGSSRQTLLVVEGASVRARLVSGREAARLMGLPEDYVLPRRYNEAYELVGDGVAPPVVRFLATHLFEPLLGASQAEAA
jgi:DNA (cytosine-5)-methyltransferase 1